MRKSTGVGRSQATSRDVFEYIDKKDEPFCVGGIAKVFGITWPTAKTLLLELVLEQRIGMKKCGRSWIVWPKKTT